MFSANRFQSRQLWDCFRGLLPNAVYANTLGQIAVSLGRHYHPPYRGITSYFCLSTLFHAVKIGKFLNRLSRGAILVVKKNFFPQNDPVCKHKCNKHKNENFHQNTKKNFFCQKSPHHHHPPTSRKMTSFDPISKISRKTTPLHPIMEKWSKRRKF